MLARVSRMPQIYAITDYALKTDTGLPRCLFIFKVGSGYKNTLRQFLSS